MEFARNEGEFLYERAYCPVGRKKKSNRFIKRNENAGRYGSEGSAV